MRWIWLLALLVLLLVFAEVSHRAHSLEAEDDWTCYHSHEFASFRACGRTAETKGEKVGQLMVVRKGAIVRVMPGPRSECTKIETLAGHAMFVEGRIEWVLHRLHKGVRQSAPCLPQ